MCKHCNGRWYYYYGEVCVTSSVMSKPCMLVNTKCDANCDTKSTDLYCLKYSLN